MSVQRIAYRYAKSLLDLAIERNELESVVKDMKHLQDSLQSRDFLLMLKSPIIQSGKKRAVMQRLFSNQLGKTGNAFMDIMVRKGRENHLPEIIHSFMDQYRQVKEISTVLIKSAAPLDEFTMKKIREKLQASRDTKANLEFQVEVDPSLIGGFILSFEGKEYDSSIASKLKSLRKHFSNHQ